MGASKAIVALVFIAALLGCSGTDYYLGWVDDAAAGGSSGTGGTTGSGGSSGGSGGSGGSSDYIGHTGPGGQSGTGGSSGAGGSSASDAGASLAELCSSTGGTIAGKSCCLAESDFPSSCLVGACSCSAANSKTISICNCKTGTCFDPVLGCRPNGDGGP